MSAFGHSMRLKNGAIQWTSIVFDSTEMIQRRHALDQQRAQTETLQRRENVGRLTRGVAHDFNNILTVVLGNLELLQGNETDRDKLDMLAAASSAVLQGAELTRNM